MKIAQQSVVEFLLINHPLDCPVCDKGGECPLQDITFGWGGGISRFIEPKRHFVKPLELSPLIAIDRERCILCYRCVRFSQEVSEDYQLVLLERGAHSYVATFDGHPYVAPFSGNIVELCPVGALTSRPYRFRARPWDIEGAGSVCTLCPAQCNVTLTVRDERALRVLARENAEVDDGWLCDKGRFAYQSFHVEERITEPLLRDGGQLRPVSWERALGEAAAGLRRAGARDGARSPAAQATNEEGLLLARLMREALGSPHLDSRRAGALPLELQRALGDPALQARVSDLEFAHAVLVLGRRPRQRRADPRPAPAQGRAPPRHRSWPSRCPSRDSLDAERARCRCASRRAQAPRSPRRSRPRSRRAPTRPSDARALRRAPTPAALRELAALLRGPRASGEARAAARGRGPVGRAPDLRARRRRGARRRCCRSRAALGLARRRRRRPARDPGRHQRARPARGRRAAQRRARASPSRAPAARAATRTRSPRGSPRGELSALYLLQLRPAARAARRASCGGARWRARQRRSSPTPRS